ncbi:hypothetical protein O181_045913 [Austropuccinia psidii MF-1]|uniref:Retrotransposon gag domain-containing protein n=1 Tax=Austropuccinia psidii MF-1 TaxID=1389203 RepID=A0A9Q3HI17_9BASI|nr:hypothetical protein [Austropuccinia psidii MF-1]
MEQRTQLLGELTQALTPRYNSKSSAFKTPSIKEPDSFDYTQAHKLRGLIQTCQLISHKNPVNFFSYRKKVHYSTSFLPGRAGKWLEPYLSNISNEDPSYLLNNWKLFETQLFMLLGDPNEVRKAEQELKNLRIKESGHLASHAGTFDTFQELMEITLELDTSYHERQKEKGGNQEKKPPVTGSYFSRPPQDLSSKSPHHKKNKKGKQSQAPKEKASGIKEGLFTYCG